MAQLRPVPDAPPRALGMIRVSKERDGMMSPDVQRVAIQDYCNARGYVVVDWLEGLDESGSRARSAWWPRLDQAVERVTSGDVDVIVVWKFSRTARHRLRWAVALDAVDTAGGRLESATEQVDATTSTGRFTRGMLAELNAFEAERIGEGWREVHASRLAAGLAPNGKPRFGYVWNVERKVHEPDPVTGPALAEVYERYVMGASIYTLVRWLNAERVLTTAGNQWTDHSLRRVLDSGFASGQLRWHGRFHPGVHEPLISAELWQRFLDARAARRNVPANVKRSKYTLSGLVRCGRCEGPMVANSRGPDRPVSLRCTTAKERGPEACAGGYVAMSAVLDVVKAWLAREAAGDVDRAAPRVRAGASSGRRVSAEGQMRALSREVERIDKALKKLAMQNAEEQITDRELRDARADYLVDRQRAVERLEELGAASRRRVVDRPAVAAGLLEEWDELPVETRRATLGSLIERVVVVTGDRSGVRGVQGGASNARVSVVPTE